MSATPTIDLLEQLRMAHSSSMRSQRWAHALLEHTDSILLRRGHYTRKFGLPPSYRYPDSILFYENGRPGVRLDGSGLFSAMEHDAKAVDLVSESVICVDVRVVLDGSCPDYLSNICIHSDIWLFRDHDTRGGNHRP